MSARAGQIPAGFRAIQRQLATADPDAAAALVTGALEALAALAPEYARELEIETSAFASERGREGEAHALWDRRALPVFHERAAEERTRSEDPGFLRRVTTRTELACRTLVVDEHRAWHLVYWTARARTTEHGSERAAEARGVTSITIERAIEILGAGRLAAALVALELPGAGACAAVDGAGALCWGPLPALGYRYDDTSEELFGAWDPPAADPMPSDPVPDEGEAAVAVPLPRSERRPLARRALPPIVTPPAPWS